MNTISKIKNLISTKKFWWELFLMTFMMLIAAIDVHFFLVPSKLIIGSISGLSIVFSTITHLPVSTIAFIINLILLLLAFILIGKEFGAKTVYTALMLSPWLLLLEKVAPIDSIPMVNGSVMGDPWLDLLCFVVILSATQVVLFRINASTGGLDIIAKIVNKYLHFDIGISVSIAGALICCTAFLINPFRMVIIGLIGTWINGLVLNHFTAGMNQKKKVCIISTENDKIKKFILDELGRGVTIYNVKGGYSGSEATEIEVLLARDEFSTLMKFIEKESIKTFMTAGNVSEVYGHWNKPKKLKKKSAISCQ